MTVDLLRHGQTAVCARYLGSTDVALSRYGWQQMHSAVAGRSWDLIVSSPLRRCADFAWALAHERQLPCRIDSAWREMSFGAWEGRSAAELLESDGERLRSFWADPGEQSPPDGEPLAVVSARVTRARQRILGDPGAARVLVVTHGGPIRILSALRSRLASSALLTIDVPHAALVRIDEPADRAATARVGVGLP